MTLFEASDCNEARAASQAAGASPCDTDLRADIDLSILALDTAGERCLRRLIAQGGPVRLGILGGTFDPVHNGHVYCAQYALDLARLDMVLFMPAGMPVFKLDKPVTKAEHRLEMCHCAMKGDPCFAVSAIEVNREGKTFTADTLRAMRAVLPDSVELFFIMGADSANSFLKWREHDAIAQLATLVVFTSDDHAVPPEQQEALRDNGVSVEYVAANPPDISSTQVREMVRNGQLVNALMPASVYDYVSKKCLYTTEREKGEEASCGAR